MAPDVREGVVVSDKMQSSIVVAVDRKNEDLLIPTGDTSLRAGDAVILMVKNESREDVRAVLAGAKTPA